MALFSLDTLPETFLWNSLKSLACCSTAFRYSYKLISNHFTYNKTTNYYTITSCISFFCYLWSNYINCYIYTQDIQYIITERSWRNITLKRYNALSVTKTGNRCFFSTAIHTKEWHPWQQSQIHTSASHQSLNWHWWTSQTAIYNSNKTQMQKHHFENYW